MKITHSIFLFLLILASSISRSHAEIRTVEKVDLGQYIGTWYEIASIPQSFSKGCHCTRAAYSLKPNGNISVFNTCNKNSIDGRLKKATGTARVKDTETNAKLKVSFFWPFSGDYWIIGLDKDYRYAVVSNSVGSTLWILSRTPSLEDALLKEALNVVETNGIDTSLIQTTVQNGCTYL